MANGRKKQTTLNHYFNKNTKQPLPRATLPQELPNQVNVKDHVELMNLDTEATAPNIDSGEDEDEEEEVVVRKRKRRIVASDESSNGSDEEPLQERISRLRQQDGMEQCDINDEELDFLDKSDILQERTRGKQVSRYSEALKKLADRKARLEAYQGERGPIEDYVFSDSSEEEFVVDDDIIDGVKKTDEDSEMAMMEMPVEFSSARAQSFTSQLSIYIEYLIQLAVNPDFENGMTTNKRYQIAKNAVIRRVQSYKDSMVTSDVWISTFKDVVDANEHWTVTDDCVITGVKCDACRSNKPASFEVMLSSDNSPNEHILYLGSECCRKGEMYHAFFHFELHMSNHINQVVTKMMLENPFFNKDTVLEALFESQFIKNKIEQVKDSFNTVNRIYNLKNQRSQIVDDTSSSENSSYED